MKCSKNLVFSPMAWAKIQWMMDVAGKLEISGWGISSEDDWNHIIDFQTVKQECTSVETEMDNVDLAVYMTRMASGKDGMDPCRFMRIWIHSHPFAATKPSPSSQDKITLRETTGADSHWAVMVIFGLGDPYASLQIRDPLLEEPIEMEMECEVDWTMLPGNSVVSKWEKEFKRNIKEAPTPEVVVVDHRGKNRQPWEIPNRKKGLAFTDFQAEYRGYKNPYVVFGISLVEYAEARAEGYTKKEIIHWRDEVVHCTPELLRSTEGFIEQLTASEVTELKRIQAQDWDNMTEAEWNAARDALDKETKGNNKCKLLPIKAAGKGKKKGKNRKNRRK